MNEIDRAEKYALENIVACCKELIEWHQTTRLCNGHVRYIAEAILPHLGHQSLTVAENIVRDIAVKLTAGEMNS